MSRVLAPVVTLLFFGLSAAPQAEEGPEGLAWCYRTLGDVVCYTAPDPGRENRFVGTYRFRPDAARRLLLRQSERRAAALAPKSRPPASPATRAPVPPRPATEVPADGGPAAGTSVTGKASGDGVPVPVMRPSRERTGAPRAGAVEGAAKPVPAAADCSAARRNGPRPLTGTTGGVCGVEAD